MMGKIRAFIKHMNWLLVASALTVLYVWGVRETIQPERLKTFIRTAELNAVGDFLAGTFAPLAFIWLVAAVLTQRQELNDTREQFVANQRVTDGQLTIVKDQTALVQKQNDRAEKSAERNYRLNLFPERLELFKAYDAICRQIEQTGWQAAHEKELTVIGQRCQFVFSEGVRDYVLKVAGLGAEISKIEGQFNSARDPWGNIMEDSLGRAEYLRLHESQNRLKDQLRDEVRLAMRMLHFEEYLTVTDVRAFSA